MPDNHRVLPEPPSDTRLPKQQRLRTTADFKRCFDGQRAGNQHLLIFVQSNELSKPRLGVSVSRKHGNAVCRNLKKRRLREAFRTVKAELPQDFDFVLVPRQRSNSTLADYQSSLLALAKKIARRLEQHSRTEGGGS